MMPLSCKARQQEHMFQVSDTARRAAQEAAALLREMIRKVLIYGWMLLVMMKCALWLRK